MAREKFTSYPKSKEFDIQALLNAEAIYQGLFCLSPATWELCYSLVSFYGLWRSRYYFTDETGEKLTITDEEYEQVDEIYQTALEELQMAGCEELAAAINNVALALAGQNQPSTNVDCVDGETVCIVTNNINVDGTDTEDPIDGDFEPGSEIPPDGFESMEDYRQYKCEIANLIVDGIIKTMRGMSIFTAILSLGQVIAAGIAAGTAGTVIILTPLGFVALVAAVLAVLAAGLGSTTLLFNLADEIEANRQEIVCRLYSSGNTETAINSAIDGLEELFSAAILAAGIPGALEGAAAAFLGTVAANLINSDTLNQLFTLIADVSYAGADCSECGTDSDCPFVFQYGSGLWKYNNEPFVISSTPGPPGYHSISAVVDVVEECYANYCVTFVSRSGGMNNGSDNRTREVYHYINTTGSYATRQYDFAHTPPGVDAFPPLNQKLPIFGMYFTDDNPFTVTMRISGTVPGDSDAPDLSDACDV